MGVTDATTVEPSHKGRVSAVEVQIATDKVKAALRHCREPVHHIELRLALESNPGRDRPALAEVTVDVAGQPVRAHVAAATVGEATDLLVDRLRRRLDRHEDRRHRLADRHRTGDSGAHEWRHGDLMPDQAEYLDVPFGEREIRRTKTLAPTPMSVEEAAFDLDVLDHRFYLFVEATTGKDAVIETGDEALTLALAGPELPDVPEGVRGTTSPPATSLAGAKEQLEVTGDHHLFFVGSDGDRGQVLYRRYDGHYGLVLVA
jgi:ribosome-associated translation inhibitor RaiA